MCHIQSKRKTFRAFFLSAYPDLESQPKPFTQLLVTGRKNTACLSGHLQIVLPGAMEDGSCNQSLAPDGPLRVLVDPIEIRALAPQSGKDGHWTVILTAVESESSKDEEPVVGSRPGSDNSDGTGEEDKQEVMTHTDEAEAEVVHPSGKPEVGVEAGAAAAAGDGSGEQQVEKGSPSKRGSAYLDMSYFDEGQPSTTPNHKAPTVTFSVHPPSVPDWLDISPMQGELSLDESTPLTLIIRGDDLAKVPTRRLSGGGHQSSVYRQKIVVIRLSPGGSLLLPVCIADEVSNVTSYTPYESDERTQSLRATYGRFSELTML